MVRSGVTCFCSKSCGALKANEAEHSEHERRSEFREGDALELKLVCIEAQAVTNQEQGEDHGDQADEMTSIQSMSSADNLTSRRAVALVIRTMRVRVTAGGGVQEKNWLMRTLA